MKVTRYTVLITEYSHGAITADIEGEGIQYADVFTHHGVQCNYTGSEPEHEQILNISKGIATQFKELHQINNKTTTQ
jgi:hypothetical protein